MWETRKSRQVHNLDIDETLWLRAQFLASKHGWTTAQAIRHALRLGLTFLEAKGPPPDCGPTEYRRRKWRQQGILPPKKP